MVYDILKIYTKTELLVRKNEEIATQRLEEEREIEAKMTELEKEAEYLRQSVI